MDVAFITFLKPPRRFVPHSCGVLRHELFPQESASCYKQLLRVNPQLIVTNY